jgi:hypothetical protein
MERICDGTYQYPAKGAAAVLLKKPTVIVVSNMPPEEVYTS